MPHKIEYLATADPAFDAMRASSDESFPRHSHDQFGIGIVVAGIHRSHSDAGLVEGGTNDLILVNPGEVHDGRVVDAGSRSWQMLYIDPARLQNLAGEMREGAASEFALNLPVLSDARAASRFVAAFDAVTDTGRADTDRVDLALLDLLDAFGFSGTGRALPDAPLVQLVLDRIHDDPIHDISLQDLARESGCSRFALYRAFLGKTGLSPQAYMTQRRLAIARRLIRGGTAIADAAAAAGFFDQSHLHRHFTKVFGTPPGRYQRQR